MDLLQQTKKRMEGIEFGTSTPELDAPIPGTDVRAAEVKKPVPAVESFLTGLAKSSTYQGIKYLVDPPEYHRPTEEDITQYPEILEGIPLNEQYKVLGQPSKADAEQKAAQIRERMKMEEIQFANGGVIGFGSEIASYFDPPGLLGGSAINSIMKVPKTFRMAKTAERLLGAGSLGAMTYAEEAVRNEQMGKDDDDVLYAVAGAMAIGAGIGPLLARHQGTGAEVLAEAETRTKALGKNVQRTMDDNLVLHPEWDTKPMIHSDEAYDVSGRGIEVSDEIKEANVSMTGTKNFTDEEHQILAQADELKARGEVADPEELGKLRKLFEKNALITDGMRAALSKSPVANVIATHLGELTTGIRGKVATTAAMHKRMIETGILQDLNPVLKTSQIEFLSRRGIKQRNIWKFHGEGQRSFYKELRLELNRRAMKREPVAAIDDAITKAADAIDRATKRGLEELQAAKWIGADEVKWKAGYTPLVWSDEEIIKFANAGRLDDVREVLNRGYQSVGMSPELSKRLAAAIVNRNLAKASDVEFNPASLFSQASRGELEGILREGGVLDTDIKGIMKLVEREPAGMPKRTDIDLSQEYNGISLIDLINNDIGDNLSKWTQRTAGMAGLAKKGITSIEQIDSWKKLVRSQGAGAGEDVEKLGASTDAIFDALLAKPVNGGVSRNVRRAMSWSMLSKLGQLVFPQVAEMGNITSAHGFFNAIKQVPIANRTYSQLIKAGKTGDMSGVDKAFMGEIQVLGGQMWDEHLIFRPSVHLDEKVDGGWAGIIDNVTARAEDAIGTLSGFHRVKGMEQVLTTMLQVDKIAKLTQGKLTKAKIARLKEIGWGDEVLQRIVGEFKKNASFDKKVLDRLNLENWDAVTRTEFLQGLHRHVNQAIQLPMIGEGFYWMHKDVASLLLQFRTFPMVALEKQTGRHLIAGDQEMALAMLYGSAWSSMAGMAKVYTNSIGRKDQADYIERNMTPLALITRTQNYSPFASLGAEGMGVIADAAGFGYGGSRGVGLAPALTGFNQMYQGVTSLPTGVTERGVRNLMSGVILGNTPAASITTNILTRGLD